MSAEGHGPPHRGSAVSVELLLMVRPFRVYRSLATDAREGPWLLVQRVLLLLGVVAGFVSITTSGRFVLHHLVGTALAWSFVPMIQLFVAAVVARAFAPAIPARRALSMHVAGNGPHLVLLVLLSLTFAAPGDVPARVFFLLDNLGLFAGFVAAFVWGAVLTFAWLRAGLGLGVGRAAIATLLDVSLKIVLVLAWYQSIDNLVPQFALLPSVEVSCSA